MAEVQPTNNKLKQRLANILVALVNDDDLIKDGISVAKAHELLAQHNYKVGAVINQLQSCKGNPA
jgi:N-acetylmuramic acid 6-phosphate (MurNAc-6-P) etherase